MMFPEPNNKRPMYPKCYTKLVEACYAVFGEHIIYLTPEVMDRVKKAFPPGQGRRNLYHQCNDALRKMSEGGVPVGGYIVSRGKGGSYRVEKVRQ